jgi:hypothetical protein
MQTQSPWNLFWKVTAIYAVCFVLVGLLYSGAPWLADYLPVGRAERLFSTPDGPGLTSPMQSEPLFGDKSHEGSKVGRLVFLGMVFGCSILVMVPVALTYIGTHAGKRSEAFIVRTILILPVAVTGLVLIVQNSIALAFGLAGIVAGAGVRFRSNIREMTDAVYFLIAVGVGLASGVGSIGLAVLMSFLFCYAILAIHGLKVGGDPVAMAAKKKDKEKGKDKEPGDDDDD